MFEGHDTTATNMSFTLWLLATHPQIQRRFDDKILLGLTMWSDNLMMITTSQGKKHKDTRQDNVHYSLAAGHPPTATSNSCFWF